MVWGECGLTPDWQVCMRIATGLVLSITASTEPLCCTPYGRHTLIRCAHPTGQPAAVTALRYVSLLAQERCAKEGTPTSGFRYAKLDSLCSPYVPAFRLLLRFAAFPRSGAAPGAGLHGLKLSGVCFCFCSRTAILQTTPVSPSGGRVESPWKGVSDMDVARAAMGQGWPFAACPWSGDGRREPRRSRGRM